jgi:hypothetical protein
LNDADRNPYRAILGPCDKNRKEMEPPMFRKFRLDQHFRRHNVKTKRFAGTAQSFTCKMGPLLRPRIVVLLGGDSATFSFPPPPSARPLARGQN